MKKDFELESREIILDEVDILEETSTPDWGVFCSGSDCWGVFCSGRWA
ncbi:hypothetical protein RBU61_09485 [Tissierella sp. MB52-C2]|nr:hypothetical protein [Tissierella sp. MB52-C2]WMM26883.1 hypothetical protein RBU61_09485 [Tissierella sp. MB52-C2]